MNCEECRSKIRGFLNNTLDERNRKQVINHSSKCPECLNEIKLNYFVGEGLKRLEEGGSLDLESEFQNMMNGERTRIRDLFRTNYVLGVGFILAALSTLYFLVKSIIMFS